MQILVDLDDGLLRRVFGVGFVLEQGEEQKVDGALAGTDEVVKQVLLAGKNAADALGFEFRIGKVIRSRDSVTSPSWAAGSSHYTAPGIDAVRIR